MASSGVTEWVLTARDIVTAALQENAIIALGEEPEAEELFACITRLNALRKSWTGGVDMEAVVELPILAGARSLALDANVLDVTDVRLVVSATYRRPLSRTERSDFNDYPNRMQAGEPLVYYVSQERGTAVLEVWPVPSRDMTLEIDYTRIPETITDPGETVDIPERYQEALYANLAVRCAGLFGEQAPPELIQRAADLKREMEDDQRPESYTLEPEYHARR